MPSFTRNVVNSDYESTVCVYVDLDEDFDVDVDEFYSAMSDRETKEMADRLIEHGYAAKPDLLEHFQESDNADQDRLIAAIPQLLETPLPPRPTPTPTTAKAAPMPADLEQNVQRILDAPDNLLFGLPDETLHALRTRLGDERANLASTNLATLKAILNAFQPGMAMDASVLREMRLLVL